MKLNELDRCLTGKLRLVPRPENRHKDYRLECAGRIIALPALLRVSHGAGELDDNNLGGIAKGLGLNEYATKEMLGCRVGRGCVLLCLAAKLIEFANRKMEEQGEVFYRGVVTMIESVEMLLLEPELINVTKWTSSESKMLKHWCERLKALVSAKYVSVVAQRIVSRIGEI